MSADIIKFGNNRERAESKQLEAKAEDLRRMADFIEEGVMDSFVFAGVRKPERPGEEQLMVHMYHVDWQAGNVFTLVGLLNFIMTQMTKILGGEEEFDPNDPGPDNQEDSA